MKGFLHLKLQYSENKSLFKDARSEETSGKTLCQLIINGKKICKFFLTVLVFATLLFILEACIAS